MILAATSSWLILTVHLRDVKIGRCSVSYRPQNNGIITFYLKIVFDTWAKLPSSILRGNRVITGGFTDCVNFRHQSKSSAIGTFQGQHCMVDFSPTPEVNEIDRDNGFDWKEM